MIKCWDWKRDAAKAERKAKWMDRIRNNNEEGSDISVDEVWMDTMMSLKIEDKITPILEGSINIDARESRSRTDEEIYVEDTEEKYKESEDVLRRSVRKRKQPRRLIEENKQEKEKRNRLE